MKLVLQGMSLGTLALLVHPLDWKLHTTLRKLIITFAKSNDHIEGSALLFPR